MRKAVLAIALLLPIPIRPQAPSKPADPPTFVKVLDDAVVDLEGELIPAVEAMPEDKYDFVPTTGEYKGARTFAKQVRHIAMSNYWFGYGILGGTIPVENATHGGPPEIKTKAQLVKFLKDSFAYTHKAIATITEKNVIAPMKTPWGTDATRLRLATFVESHGYNHYGQIVEYLRLNGIVPPASRKR